MIADATNVDVKLENTHFHLESTRKGDETKYTLDFELAKSINAAESTYAVRARQIEFVLIKDDSAQGYWNALLKDKNQYKGRVSCDWDLYVDEDEQHEADKNIPEDFGGMGGMPPGMGGMGGMPGMPGMGGMGGGAPGGFDMAQMMQMMGGAGGAGGAGGMDFSSMLGGMQGGMGGMGGDDMGAPDSDDEDEIPGLDTKDDEDQPE